MPSREVIEHVTTPEILAGVLVMGVLRAAALVAALKIGKRFPLIPPVETPGLVDIETTPSPDEQLAVPTVLPAPSDTPPIPL